MLAGTVGAVLIVICPSSATNKDLGSIRAGRIPKELEQTSLRQSPVPLRSITFRDPAEPQAGERRYHQQDVPPILGGVHIRVSTMRAR